MLQNSNQYLKYTLIVFGVSFVLALIFFLNDSVGDVEWLSYEQGIEKAKEEQKPILLFVHNRWSKDSKLANNAIFSNDSAVQFIHSNFIPIKMDFSNELEKNILNNRYKIESSDFTIVLDKNSRTAGFLNNSWSSGVFMNFAKKILEYPMLEFSDFDTAIEENKRNNKPILVFVSNSNYQYINFNNMLMDSVEIDYIKENFNVCSLLSSDDRDISILNKYLPNDSPIIDFNKKDIPNRLFLHSIAPNSHILILNSSDELVDTIELDDEKDYSLRFEIEKIINKEN